MVESITKEAAEVAARESALGDLELNLLLEAIVRFSGHDFRDYSQATLRRRIAERVRAEGVATVSGLQERVLHDPEALARFVFAMSGGSGELFRDPGFFASMRGRVVPLLRTYSFVRVWVPNCGTGEEAYAIAALFHEADLLSKAMIYATDASELAIAYAKSGAFEVDSLDELKNAYRAAGLERPLDEIAEVRPGEVRFREELKKNLIFAQHSVVTDGSLNEFHLIVARGLLPQFNKSLQFRAHNLFANSLIRLGFLSLGPNESLKRTPHERLFRELIAGEPIYRRMR